MVSVVKRASVKVELRAAEEVEDADRARHVPRASAVVAGEHVDDVLGVIDAQSRPRDRRGCRARPSSAFVYWRSVLKIQVLRELDEPLVRLRIERFVEPPFERVARELAVAVVHDQLIDRFLAQCVDRAVVVV